MQINIDCELEVLLDFPPQEKLTLEFRGGRKKGWDQFLGICVDLTNPQLNLNCGSNPQSLLFHTVQYNEPRDGVAVEEYDEHQCKCGLVQFGAKHYIMHMD